MGFRGKKTVVDVDPASNIQKKIHRAKRFGVSLQLTEEEKRNSLKERSFSICVFFLIIELVFSFRLFAKKLLDVNYYLSSNIGEVEFVHG